MIKSEQSDKSEVPEPQGKFAGVPYDFRRPSMARLRARWWNPNDRRLFTPKALGWGFDVNTYWLAHPLDYLSRQTKDD